MAEWGDWLQGPALTLHPIERAALPTIDWQPSTRSMMATVARPAW